MKKIALVAALGLVGLAGSVANAAAVGASTTSTFNVNLTLNPKCYVNMVAGTPASVATADVGLTYTSFQSTDAENSTGFKVACTNGFTYGISIDTVASNKIADVQYYINLTAGTTATYASSTSASLTGRTGSGVDQDYTIAVRAPKDQAGTCATASANGSGQCSGTNLHTITVSY